MSAINGNVILTFSEGAVDKALKFNVFKYYNESRCGLLVKMKSIEPVMNFKNPVRSSIRYGGEMAIGDLPPWVHTL